MMPKPKSITTETSEFPHLRLRHHVAISDGGHDHDLPINAARHRLELGVGLGAFDHKDAVAKHHLKQKDAEQKDTDGAGTATKRLPQNAGVINELEQLEHPQDAAELENPKQQLTAHLRHEEEQHCVGVDQSGEAQ